MSKRERPAVSQERDDLFLSTSKKSATGDYEVKQKKDLWEQTQKWFFETFDEEIKEEHWKAIDLSYARGTTDSVELLKRQIAFALLKEGCLADKLSIHTSSLIERLKNKTTTIESETGEVNDNDSLVQTNQWFFDTFGKKINKEYWRVIDFSNATGTTDSVELLKREISFALLKEGCPADYVSDRTTSLIEQLKNILLPTIKNETSEVNEIDLLARTKQWFFETFDKELNEENWQDIDFSKAITGTADDQDEFDMQITIALAKEKVCLSGAIPGHISSLTKRLKNPSSSTTPQSTKLSPEKLQEQFNLTYQGKVVQQFEVYLNACYANWKNNRSNWHSPYTCVVQSSGYGKSRMCKEFAQMSSEWLTVYFCLRPRESTGYPERNASAVNFLTQIADNGRLDDMKRWINACCLMRILFRNLFYEKNDGKEVLGELLQACATQTSVDRIIKISEPGAFDASAERQAFWTLSENATTANQLHDCVEKLCKMKPAAIETPAQNVLLVLDEARFLVEQPVKAEPGYTLFRLLRGALKSYHKHVFAVLVDTTSRLSNFSPPLRVDPSFRLPPGDVRLANTKLFMPFHWVATTDLLCDTQKDSPYVLGRPLWKAFQSSKTNLGDLKFLAETKLLNGQVIKENEAIAVMAVLTGINVSPISSTAEVLVGSHMATCYAIDDNREAMYIAYPVEPILTEAAMGILRKSFIEFKVGADFIVHLSNHLRIGTLNAGYGGELVAKILLLLARCKTSEEFKNCGLKEFLEAFLGPLHKVEAQVKAGEISFTCFRKLTRWGKPFKKFWKDADPQSALKAFYQRRAAMEFPTNQRGADLLIPVLVDKAYRYILIQVKNVLKYTSDEACEKLTPENVFGKASPWIQYDIGFSLLINVGTESAASAASQDAIPSNMFYISKLDSFLHLVDEDLISGLESLLREPEIKDWIEADKKSILLDFDPLMHEFV